MVVACAVLLAGCTLIAPQPPAGSTSTRTPAPSATAPTQTPAVTIPWQPSGTSVLETGLQVPWSVVPLASGSALISERDSATVLERLPDGGIRTVGPVPGVAASGEGGLLGLAVPRVPEIAFSWLYAYETTNTDNRVIRMPLNGVSGRYSLGEPQNVITGIPRAGNHDGGRLAFGPDGMLYITTGDAGDDANAQNLSSLGGKILRITPDGDIPADNPFPGSPVYSYGHRNVQGIAWDSHGTMWASEFGANTWDELNIIKPGGDYGWPIVEGIAHDSRFTDPVYQWHTDQASPSGIAIVGDTIFMASLRGEKLWTIWSTNGHAPVTVAPYFVGTFGRLRAVVAVADGLWMLTNNTDGRGTPRAGDDKLIAVTLVPAAGNKRPG
ncbi:MAG TPA: PQQ-dependent sugar dehydrogenase [Diaminobutyricibacter sp.]